MDWTKVTIAEGWTLSQDDASGENTLSAKFYAMNRDDLPERGDSLCAVSGHINCPPDEFLSYKVASVTVSPLTIVGPYIAEVTATRWLRTQTGSGSSRSLLSHTSFSMSTENRMIARDDKKNSASHQYLHPARQEGEFPFILLNTTFYSKKTTSVSLFGAFCGVVPKSSFPQWLSDVPGGDNRWRLVSQSVEKQIDNDGRTVIYRITRTFLGIPDSFLDRNGNRMQWDQNRVGGQRNWDEI